MCTTKQSSIVPSWWWWWLYVRTFSQRKVHHFRSAFAIIITFAFVSIRAYSPDYRVFHRAAFAQHRFAISSKALLNRTERRPFASSSILWRVINSLRCTYILISTSTYVIQKILSWHIGAVGTGQKCFCSTFLDAPFCTLQSADKKACEGIRYAAETTAMDESPGRTHNIHNSYRNLIIPHSVFHISGNVIGTVGYTLRRYVVPRFLHLLKAWQELL